MLRTMLRLRPHACVVPFLISMAALPLPRVAEAATFHVNVTLDLVDAHPGDGVCSAGPAGGVAEACSLRAAIMEANTLGGPDRHVIHVPAGIHVVTLQHFLEDPGYIEDQYQQLNLDGVFMHHMYNDFDIGVDLEIIGAGEGVTIIRGRNTDRVFHILNRDYGSHPGPAYVRIANLTVQGGRTAQCGSGIFISTASEVVLDDVTVEENRGHIVYSRDGISITSRGGGICSEARDLRINRATIRNNVAGAGGGLAVVRGWATVRDSTFEGNQAHMAGSGAGGISGALQGMGGGIAVFDPPGSPAPALEMSGSTLTGNQASDGGGLAAWGYARVVNSTISGNTASRGAGAYIRTPTAARESHFEFTTVVYNRASAAGGGVYREVFGDSTFQFSRSIVAVNRPENCVSTVSELPRPLSGGYNLEDADSCRFRLPTDLRFRVPRVGPLRDNGGETETHALMHDSAAINRAGLSSVTVDQRGVGRPQGSAMDIGAYEFMPFNFTPYRMPDRIQTLYSFSIPIEVTGTSGATIRSIVPASDAIKLTVKVDKSRRSAIVSATGLKIDADAFKQETGQKRPVLFLIELDSGGDGSERLEVAQPRFDAMFKDVTRLPISQK